MIDALTHDGFLADLYLRQFDKDRYRSIHIGDLDAKTLEIIDAYEALAKSHPPQKLEKEGVPEELWEGLKKIGIFGLNVPESYGGVGLDLMNYLKVVEVIAKRDMALALIPIAHLSIGMKGIQLFGNEKQKRQYLTPAASGEMIFAYALTEPKFGSDARSIETRAVLSEDGRHYILNGQKTYITNGNYAGGLTVFAQMDEGKPGFMGAFIVETGWDGVAIGRDMPKMGLTISSTTAISFKDVRVPVENLLADPGDGFKVAMTVLNYGRLGLGAASVGVMNRAVEDMVKRAASRKQFGVPIDHFELVQDKIVKTRVHGYVAAAMTNFTAKLLEADPLAKVAIESSHCKLFGTTRAWDALYDALQVAGGAGYIATQPYEKRVRDFRVTTVFEGTTEIHSMYPPLYLSRKIGKELKALGHNKMARLRFLVGHMSRKLEWPTQFKKPSMARAERFARHNARLIRWTVYIGLMIHGKKISQRQFFLRRITHLSVDLYAILSALTDINSRLKQGVDVKKELRLLSYFLEEAKTSRKENRQIFTSKRESLHKKIFKDIQTFS
ncbi:MAG: acyl-CoA dehydrogenase family protein [bacterium]|nr:acyl-CoA dehydrogenase family protein [bacterium]